MVNAVSLAIESTARHAELLVDTLVDHGPSTSAELCTRLGWSKGRLTTAIKHAREHTCPALGLGFPNPTPTDGWRYQVTTDWEPVEAGAAYALGMVESRLINVHRDVKTVRPQLTKGSKEWRRANFLEKHLSHITATLGEINNG